MSRQAKLFWIVTVITLVWIVVTRPFTPSNIVAFEFAKNVDNAKQIIAQWGEAGISKARLSIYLDFVFVFLYSLSISLGSRVAASFSANQNLIQVGSFFSRGIWFAGSCDIMENIAMLFTLSSVNDLTVSMAYYFALIKFAIVFIALLLILFSVGVGLFKFIIKD